MRRCPNPHCCYWGGSLIRRFITHVALCSSLLVAVLVLTACLTEPRKDAISNPTSSSVLPSPVIEIRPTIQPTVSPAPTATAILHTPTPPSTTSISTDCAYEYFFEPAPKSCPKGEPLFSAAAEQPFEGGTMVWIEATDSIVVLYADSSWQQFEDTWSEDQPESDPSYPAPAERFQPIRGFGKVWREWSEVRDRLGWALSQELAFETVLQPQAEDSETISIFFLKLFNGQVAALIDRGAGKKEWIIAAAGS